MEKIGVSAEDLKNSLKLSGETNKYMILGGHWNFGYFEINMIGTITEDGKYFVVEKSPNNDVNRNIPVNELLNLDIVRVYRNGKHIYEQE